MAKDGLEEEGDEGFLGNIIYIYIYINKKLERVCLFGIFKREDGKVFSVRD